MNPNPARTPSLALAAAVTASVTMLTPAGAAQAASGSIAGTWTGPVFGDNGATAGYIMVVKLKRKNGRFVGKVSCPEYSCKGTWKLKSVKGKTYRFVENIKTGPCLDDVAAKVKKSGSTLKVKFTGKGGDSATVAATKS